MFPLNVRLPCRYIDLCVELQDHQSGKDGLHQYRNLSQAQAPGSLEVGPTSVVLPCGPTQVFTRGSVHCYSRP